MDSRGVFDRLADRIAGVVAHWSFFTACVVLVLLWLPSYFIVGSGDTWQLIINTTTTIITFLLVALLHNDQHRFEKAVNARMQEILDAIEGAHDPVHDSGQKEK